MPQKAIRGGTNCSSELHLSKTPALGDLLAQIWQPNIRTIAGN
jgi:hypothetical protein